MVIQYNIDINNSWMLYSGYKITSNEWHVIVTFRKT